MIYDDYVVKVIMVYYKANYDHIKNDSVFPKLYNNLRNKKINFYNKKIIKKETEGNYIY